MASGPQDRQWISHQGPRHVMSYRKDFPDFTCFDVLGKKGDCTISIKDSDFMDMVSGKLNGQKVYNDILKRQC